MQPGAYGVYLVIPNMKICSLAVKTLIDLKADLELENKIHWDWTPVHTAVMADSPEIVETLVAAGADAGARDGVGRDAQTLAEEYRKERVMQYFKRMDRAKDKGGKKP